MQCLIMFDDQKWQRELKKLLLQFFDDIRIALYKYDLSSYDFILTDHLDGLKTENEIWVLDNGLALFFTLHKDCLLEDFKAFKWAYMNKLQEELTITFTLDRKLKPFVSEYQTLLANDIIYVECFCHELIIHTYRHEYVVKMTMKHFLQEVKALGCFVQIHRTYAINMNYVYRVDKEYLYMVNDESKNELKISQKYKKEFLQIFRHYLLPYKKIIDK